MVCGSVKLLSEIKLFFTGKTLYVVLLLFLENIKSILRQRVFECFFFLFFFLTPAAFVSW